MRRRGLQVRMEFHNPGFFLKPGMFATVAIRAELDPPRCSSQIRRF